MKSRLIITEVHEIFYSKNHLERIWNIFEGKIIDNLRETPLFVIIPWIHLLIINKSINKPQPSIKSRILIQTWNTCTLGYKMVESKKMICDKFRVNHNAKKRHLFSNLFLFSGMSREMLHCFSQIIGKLEARVTSWVRRISLNFSNGEWRVKFFYENILIDALDYFEKPQQSLNG